MGCGQSADKAPAAAAPAAEKAPDAAAPAAAPDTEAKAPEPAAAPAAAGLSQNFKDLEACFKPIGDKSNKEIRGAEWGSCDASGNKKVSLAEFDAYVLKKLSAEYADKGDAIHSYFKPCYIRAFNDANDIAPGDDSYVTSREFRCAVVYLVTYASLFDCFASLDGGCGVTGADDDRVTLEEFKKGAGALKAGPFVAFTDATLDGKEEAVFKEINAEGTKILFKELCQYAEKKEEEAGTDLGKLLNLNDDDDEK